MEEPGRGLELLPALGCRRCYGMAGGFSAFPPGRVSININYCRCVAAWRCLGTGLDGGEGGAGICRAFRGVGGMPGAPPPPAGRNRAAPGGRWWGHGSSLPPAAAFAAAAPR